MTTKEEAENTSSCPAESLLKLLSGKWKPQIFRLALASPLRFNTLLRQLPGANKQSLAVALKEMEQEGLLEKTVIKLKPLHIEYVLTQKGSNFIPVFLQLEQLA